VGSEKQVQTTSVTGRYSFTRMQKGDYLVKVEKTAMALLYGAVRLDGDDQHELNLIMASQRSGGESLVGAEDPFDIPRPSGLSRVPARVKQARLLRQVAPALPATPVKALKMGVTIAARIHADGKVDDLVVLFAPNEDFALATLAAVRQWKYSPTYLDGEPVEVVTTISVGFHPR
jgi:outer membrane biosynthesis protein TonB